MSSRSADAADEKRRKNFGSGIKRKISRAHLGKDLFRRPRIDPGSHPFVNRRLQPFRFCCCGAVALGKVSEPGIKAGVSAGLDLRLGPADYVIRNCKFDEPLAKLSPMLR
jgi:hypothetical protein